MKEADRRRSKTKLRSTGDSTKVAGKRKTTRPARKEPLRSTGDSTKAVRSGSRNQ